jgi:hypothetical protein
MTVPAAREPHPAELDRVIVDLTERFAGSYEPATVAATVDAAYRKLAASARVSTYLPVLARQEAVRILRTTSPAH